MNEAQKLGEGEGGKGGGGVGLRVAKRTCLAVLKHVINMMTTEQSKDICGVQFHIISTPRRGPAKQEESRKGYTI